jgi:hypothetical protein
MEAKYVNIQITDTSRLKVHIAILAIVSLGFSPIIATAHGGEEHVIGTVVKISDTSVSVKTTAGKTVEVTFEAKTTYARAKQPIQKTDIKVGDRIVIHAMEMNKKLVAHTVEIGNASQARPPAKD